MEVEIPVKENEPEVNSNEKQESSDKNDDDKILTENGKDEQSEIKIDSTTKEPVDSKVVSEPNSENSRTDSNEDDSIKTHDQEKAHSEKTEDSEVLESEKLEEPKEKKTDELKKKGTDKSERNEAESTESENSKSDETNEEKKENTKTSEEIQNEIVQNGVLEGNANDDKKMDIDENEEDEDYFNPLLLCPDISMDVDESPVLTGSSELPQANDVSDSNSLFAPLFSTFVDEMTGAEISFNLTAEEQVLREKLYGPNNPIQYTKIHCTACNVHLGSALAGQTNRFVHPLLKVLICKECYHFYTSGEFEKDEDGSELYCRWCGQGGQVLCCTMCEFVFCKKCIRINFGRKKLTQVRDSDDWKCFRCDISQLKALRAMCVEFFEYIRKEKSRASTYTDPDIVNRDLTSCCQASNRKRGAEQEQEAVVRKPKRRRVEEDDPDYDPYKKEDDEGSNSSIPSTSGVKVSTVPVKPAPVAPKTPAPEASYPGKGQPPTIRIGSTIVNKLSSTSTVPQRIAAPPVVSRNTAIRSSLQAIRAKPTLAPRTVVPNAVRPVIAQLPVAVSSAQVRPVANQRQNLPPPLMKHEWFEKTVRAAARVNSNLSYTLTQLNKAQSSASSVEQLAVVHNKLQEILSSSINSLIQIRKNLRTEFIAGIKTIRFPPKPAVDPNDDDVIIVNSEPTKTSSNKLSPAPRLTPITRPVRTAPTTIVKTYSINSSTPSGSAPSKGYLKVRSFSQLQNVTSECITIPDDDPPPLPPVPKEPIVVEINEEEIQKEPIQKEEEIQKEPEQKEEEIQKETEQKEKEIQKEPEQKEEEVPTQKEEEEPTQKEEEEPTQKEEEEPIQKEDDNDSSPEFKGFDSKDEKKDKEKGDDESAKKENSHKARGKGEENNEKNTLKKDEEVENKKGKSENNDSASKTNGSTNEETDKSNGKVNDEVTVKTEPEEHSYNVKDQPSPKIRRMLSVKVNLKKSAGVEKLIKKEPVENGD